MNDDNKYYQILQKYTIFMSFKKKIWFNTLVHDHSLISLGISSLFGWNAAAVIFCLVVCYLYFANHFEQYTTSGMVACYVHVLKMLCWWCDAFYGNLVVFFILWLLVLNELFVLVNSIAYSSTEKFLFNDA